jgi:hypothetical protein
MATLAILLTLFAFPSLRRTCPGYGRRPPHYYNVPTGDRVVDVPGDALVERDDQPADYFESAGTVRADDGAPDSRGDSPRVTHPVPQVTRLAGPFAGAGHKVTVVGAGLAATTHVYFLASDGRSGEARFRTWDDVRLMVVVPDLGSRPGGATVVVETPDGTTTPAEFYYTGR